MQTAQEKTVSFSKFRLIILLFIALFIASTAAILLTVISDADQTLRRDPVLLRTVAVILIIVSGIAALMIFSKLVAGRPALVITPEGFYNSTGGLHSGFIHWNTVEKIEQVRLAGQEFVVVFLTEPLAYLTQQTTSWKRRVLGLKSAALGSPVVLSAQGLDCSPAQLRELLQNYHAERT
ncbi:STM3941 family protein [Pedobacter sp. SYP-B3415]|uniref:STM3941 family protein n=1 Tax=Pedobacter sp. SYP-B3415 TaxID=2496641 RepID=UPI00101CD3C3|nr:STM3941 family protein [Pedobacter sp. SYP-B3415]